jgi:DNA mismatch repair protein MutS
VLKRARGLLAQLEQRAVASSDQLDLFAAVVEQQAAPAVPDRLRERLSGIDAERLAPRAALDLVFELVELLRAEEPPGSGR